MHFVAGFLNNRHLSVPIIIWDLGAINSAGDSCSSSERAQASQSISQALHEAKWIKPIPAITWVATASGDPALETRGRADDRRPAGREVPGP